MKFSTPFSLRLSVLALSTLVAGAGCQKETVSPSGGTTSSTGQAMFWCDANQGCGTITVTIKGQSDYISSYYSSGTPSCGASGCATFTLAPGTYTYSGSCSRYTWGPGTVTVTANGCQKVRLY